MQEESRTEKKVASKTSPKKKLQIVEESVISETPAQQLPAKIKETPESLKKALQNIESQLVAIQDKQASGVSAEFNALMDGYVNKANESQEFKVKYEQLVTQYEEFKLELKTTKEINKQYKEELEAAREALRASEADLQRTKKEIITSKKLYDDQFNELTDEREKLKNKVKQLGDDKDKVNDEYTKLKTEFVEMQYKTKQVEQEKQVESESARRTVKEAEKIVGELKEKLELRTREIEYKDALLNQLIKQISTEDSMAETMAKQFDQVQQPKDKSFAGFATKKDAQNGLKVKDKNSMTWGAFRN